jgi:hypothetical protein
VKRSWRWTIAERDRFAPELIVVHDEMHSRYADPENAESYFHGPDKYNEVRAYYLALTGESDCSLVRDFGPVRVYETPAYRANAAGSAR